MIDLDERLQELADSVRLPGTTAEDDLARGRTRRRRRNLGAVGAAVSTAALIGTSVVLLSGGTGHTGTSPDFAGDTGTSARQARSADVQERKEMRASRKTLKDVLDSKAKARARATDAVLSGYRDILREDLDPRGAHIQLGPITNQQGASDSSGTTAALGTKLTWNGGGMLQVAVGDSLEDVQFFCDGACTEQSVTGATKALVLAGDGRLSVAVFQDDGDIVALTADTSFGNNGTSTRSLGLSVDQLLAAAADPRLDLPADIGADQPPGVVGTQ